MQRRRSSERINTISFENSNTLQATTMARNVHNGLMRLESLSEENNSDKYVLSGLPAYSKQNTQKEASVDSYGLGNQPEGDEKMESVDTKTMSEDFLNTCGLHGINKLDSSVASTYRRKIWMFFILGSAGYLLYTVIEELKTYYTYPMTSNIRVQHKTEMDFPAVTICNLSPLNHSKANVNDSRFTNYELQFSSTWANLHQSINWIDPFYHSSTFEDPITLEALFNGSMELNNFLYECKSDLQPFKCSAVFQKVLTDVGPCFIFNKDGHFRTTRTGANFNLLLRAFIDQDNYHLSFSDGGGIKVAVHDPKYVPSIFNEGFVVSPGTVTYASIHRVQYKYLPAPFKAFSDGHCVDTENPDFVNPNKFSNYTRSSCLMECRMDFVRRNTGCTFPYPASEPPFCSLRNQSRAFDAFVQVFTNEESAKECNEQCRHPCSSMTFDYKLSHGVYPSNFTLTMIREQFPEYQNTTAEYFRENYLMLNVYYETFKTTYIEQVPVYGSVGDIFGKLGGQMGLFLGASLLTLTEIIEFCVICIYRFVAKKMNQRVQQSK